MTKRKVIQFEAVEGAAVSAKIAQVKGMLPTVHFEFKLRGQDDITIEMDLVEAGKFVQEGINAIEAAIPNIPRPRRNQVF